MQLWPSLSRSLSSLIVSKLLVILERYWPQREAATLESWRRFLRPGPRWAQRTAGGGFRCTCPVSARTGTALRFVPSNCEGVLVGAWCGNSFLSLLAQSSGAPYLTADECRCWAALNRWALQVLLDRDKSTVNVQVMIPASSSFLHEVVQCLSSCLSCLSGIRLLKETNLSSVAPSWLAPFFGVRK